MSSTLLFCQAADKFHLFFAMSVKFAILSVLFVPHTASMCCNFAPGKI